MDPLADLALKAQFVPLPSRGTKHFEEGKLYTFRLKVSTWALFLVEGKGLWASKPNGVLVSAEEPSARSLFLSGPITMLHSEWPCCLFCILLLMKDISPASFHSPEGDEWKWHTFTIHGDEKDHLCERGGWQCWGWQYCSWESVLTARNVLQQGDWP